jgi:predicted porin
MKRSGIALAVGALFVAPAALAQTTAGNVVIYGKLYPQFAWSETSGPTAAGESVSTLTRTAPNGQKHDGRFSVDVANSYIGFRGTEDLGGALKAIWQIEQAVNFDTGTDSFWANRDSFVGVAGSFGTVRLGNMDTVYKNYGDVFSVFGISSGNFVSNSNIFSQTGFTGSDARFHERQPSSVQYETPEFGGFQAGVAYSPDDETKGNPGTTRDPYLWSFGVKWEGGPLYASVQHEIHHDFFGGSSGAAALSNAATLGAHSRDTAWRLSLKYKLGNHELSAGVANMKYKETGQAPTGANPTKFQEYKHTNWAVQWDARWGPWRTAVQYTQAGEGSCQVVQLAPTGCSTDGLDGKMIALAGAYYFSKRTFIYLIGAKLINGKSAAYDNWANANPTTGADITQAALGISHTF